MTDNVTQADREAAPTADDLKAFGYAPGYYIGGCRDCTLEQKRDGRMLAKRAWRCEEHATIAWRSRPQIFTPAILEWSAGEVQRLQRELDITNADHIALWLEANGLQDNLAWLAVQIAESHDASTAALQAERDALAARWSLIDQLRDGEGHSVEIIHDNPDFGGPNCAVRTTTDSGESYAVFYGETVDACLEAAVAARKALGEG